MLPLECTHQNCDRFELIANKVLSHFNFKHADEIDMYDICRRYGIKIKPLDPHYCSHDVDFSNNAFSISTGSIGKQRKGIIYLNPELDHLNRKLCLTEEFCHLYLHHKNQMIIDKHQVEKMEIQSKKMSAYLLMPYHFLSEVFRAAFEQPVLVTEIADYFLVSEELAHYRLKLIYERNVEALVNFRGKLGTIEYF